MLKSTLFLALGTLPLLADLTATFNDEDDRAIEHIVPLPALAHEAGATPSPFLASGPFKVTWKGQLEIPKRLRLYFTFQGTGDVVLKINGKIAHEEKGELGQVKSERLRLNAGLHPVEIEYSSPTDGSGSFRLFWEERSFAREPIPPIAWKLLPDAPPALMDHGRRAFAAQRCVQCHEADDLVTPTSMPELSAMGPDLTGIGSRVSREWLTRWIAQPDLIRATTTMPAMVDHQTPEGAQNAADIAAYLTTLQIDGQPSSKEVAKDAAEKGGIHFHQLGCVACHTLPSNSIIDLKNRRIPLNNLASKFRPPALFNFLKNPREHNPWIRMPDFQLSDKEASELAIFLTEQSTGRHTPTPTAFPLGDIESGKELAKNMNCAACHLGLPAPEKSPAPPLAALLEATDWTAQGCLAENGARGMAPRLNLAEGDREAINSFAHAHLDALTRTTPARYAQRHMEELNCRACHSDQGIPPRLATLHPESLHLLTDDGEEGEKIDQSRPALTYLGEMLNTDYLEKNFRGEVEPRARPWLHLRMPAFHQHAPLLAQGMAQLHGVAPCTADNSPRDNEAAATGRSLVGMQGLACITCHGIDEMKPLAAFEVMGINFAQVNERLRPDYFYRWVGNPHRIAPQSRMPRYTTDEGKGLRDDILAGDAQKQFEAIWEYLKPGAKMEKP